MINKMEVVGYKADLKELKTNQIWIEKVVVDPRRSPKMVDLALLLVRACRYGLISR